MKKHAYKNLPSSCSSFSHYSPQIRQVKQLARNRHEQQFSLFVRMKFINLHHKKATTMTTRKVFKSKTQRIRITKKIFFNIYLSRKLIYAQYTYLFRRILRPSACFICTPILAFTALPDLQWDLHKQLKKHKVI